MSCVRTFGPLLQLCHSGLGGLPKLDKHCQGAWVTFEVKNTLGGGHERVCLLQVPNGHHVVQQNGHAMPPGMTDLERQFFATQSPSSESSESSDDSDEGSEDNGNDGFEHF